MRDRASLSPNLAGCRATFLIVPLREAPSLYNGRAPLSRSPFSQPNLWPSSVRRVVSYIPPRRRRYLLLRREQRLTAHRPRWDGIVGLSEKRLFTENWGPATVKCPPSNFNPYEEQVAKLSLNIASRGIKDPVSCFHLVISRLLLRRAPSY